MNADEKIKIRDYRNRKMPRDVDFAEDEYDYWKGECHRHYNLFWSKVSTFSYQLELCTDKEKVAMWYFAMRTIIEEFYQITDEFHIILRTKTKHSRKALLNRVDLIRECYRKIVKCIEKLIQSQN